MGSPPVGERAAGGADGPLVLRGRSPWLRERRAAGEALGCSDAEIDERWACLHALGMYIDDAGLISIDNEVFDSSGAPVMRNGVQLTRAWAHSACIATVRGAAVRITAIATTLSVNEYTNDRPVSDASATSPKVEAASSRSQMRWHTQRVCARVPLFRALVPASQVPSSL